MNTYRIIEVSLKGASRVEKVHEFNGTDVGELNECVDILIEASENVCHAQVNCSKHGWTSCELAGDCSKCLDEQFIDCTTPDDMEVFIASIGGQIRECCKTCPLSSCSGDCTLV